MQRDKEIYGNRESVINSRPQYTSGIKQDTGLPGMLDSSGDNNYASFSEIRLPYACKLFLQELNTMSIAPRMITR